MVHRSQSLDQIVKKLTRVLKLQAWTKFRCVVCGKLWGFDSFEAYVTDKTHHGMATTVERLEHLCRDDNSVLTMLDAATQRPAHRPSGGTVDNVNGSRPDGNSKQAALRRLRKDRPDLLERVVSKELSANAAMIEAGFRKRPTALQRAKAAYSKLSEKEQQEFEDWWNETYASHFI